MESIIRDRWGHRLCIHGRASHRCKDCGTGYCQHGRQKERCKDCGTGQCPHGRRKDYCGDCGKRICKHKKSKNLCLECGGERMFWGSLARMARKHLRGFLRLLGCPEGYDVRNLVMDQGVSNLTLERISRGEGYPDFENEALEEKGPKIDALQSTQWARAVLEYRAGRKYRVAWRLTSTRRKVFPNVFDFYAWQTRQINSPVLARTGV